MGVEQYLDSNGDYIFWKDIEDLLKSRVPKGERLLTDIYEKGEDEERPISKMYVYHCKNNRVYLEIVITLEDSQHTLKQTIK